MTQFHIGYHRELNRDKHQRDLQPPPKPPLQLAIKAIHRVLELLDREMLEYLDINRDILLQTFLSEHRTTPRTELNALDGEAVDCAISITLGYIKAITITHYD